MKKCLFTYVFFAHGDFIIKNSNCVTMKRNQYSAFAINFNTGKTTKNLCFLPIIYVFLLLFVIFT